jgi:hypothetical protein
VRKRLLYPLVVAAFAATFLKSASASGYCNKSTCDPKQEECEKDRFECISSGHGYYWTERPIPYRFHSGGTSRLDNRAARVAVRRAFQTWENVDCPDGPTSLRFQEGEESDTELTPGEPAPYDYAIYFRDEGWSEGANDLALTRHDGGLRTGKVWGASIEVNTAEKTFRIGGDGDGQYDFEAVMIHEVGHYLGLDHSREKDTIMHPTYCDDRVPCPLSTEQLRQLGSDDIAAVCRLYPPAKPPLNAASGCSLGGPTWPARSRVIAPATLLLPLILGLLRRRSLRPRAIGR